MSSRGLIAKIYKEFILKSYRKSTLNIHWKDWCWSWSSNTLATQCKDLTHWKRPWCWERLWAGGDGVAEDEKAGWHHQLNGYEFGQTPGVGDGQGSLAWCSPWGHKELDTTERLNWTEHIQRVPTLPLCCLWFNFCSTIAQLPVQRETPQVRLTYLTPLAAQCPVRGLTWNSCIMLSELNCSGALPLLQPWFTCCGSKQAAPGTLGTG